MLYVCNNNNHFTVTTLSYLDIKSPLKMQKLIYVKVIKYNVYLNNDMMSQSGLNDVYRYNISNVVKVDEKTYDAYVVPIEDGGPVDRSTGCLRFSKIGIEPNGEGESLVFYITFIQNQNDVTDEKLKQVYGIELRYGPSHVSF